MHDEQEIDSVGKDANKSSYTWLTSRNLCRRAAYYGLAQTT